MNKNKLLRFLTATVIVVYSLTAGYSANAETSEPVYYTFRDFMAMSDEEFYEITNGRYDELLTLEVGEYGLEAGDSYFGVDSYPLENKYINFSGEKSACFMEWAENDYYKQIGYPDPYMVFTVDEDVPIDYTLTGEDLGFTDEWRVIPVDGYYPNAGGYLKFCHEYIVYIPNEIYADFETYFRMEYACKQFSQSKIYGINHYTDAAHMRTVPGAFIPPVQIPEDFTPVDYSIATIEKTIRHAALYEKFTFSYDDRMSYPYTELIEMSENKLRTKSFCHFEYKNSYEFEIIYANPNMDNDTKFNSFWGNNNEKLLNRQDIFDGNIIPRVMFRPESGTELEAGLTAADFGFPENWELQIVDDESEQAYMMTIPAELYENFEDYMNFRMGCEYVTRNKLYGVSTVYLTSEDCLTTYGDVTNDGEIDINDAVFLLSNLANKYEYYLSEQGRDNADVYQRGDGISIGDAISIQKYLTKQIDSLPEC